MESDNPQLEYYLNATSKNDCFFIVGPESGPTERIGSFKLILMAHSEPFQKMLEDSDIFEKGDVRLPDIEPNTFKDFLKCLYGGCGSVIEKLSFEECGKMLYITEKYLVKKVKAKLITRLLQFVPLTLDDMFTALSNPVYFTNENINKAFAEKLVKNSTQIFDDKRFLNLSYEALMIIVKQDSVSVPEVIVWEAILKWGKHNTNSDKGKIVREKCNSLLEFIRFCSLDLKEFYKSVIPANLSTSEEIVELSSSLANIKCENIFGMNKESQLKPQNVEQEQQTYIHYYVNTTNLRDKEYYYSQPVELGGFRWKIMINKNSPSFEVYIYCDQSPKVKTNSSWECRAALEYLLVNQNANSNKQNYAINTFKNDTTAWGFRSFIEWNDLINPAKGFIKNNYIILLAHVKLNP